MLIGALASGRLVCSFHDGLFFCVLYDIRPDVPPFGRVLQKGRQNYAIPDFIANACYFLSIHTCHKFLITGRPLHMLEDKLHGLLRLHIR